jgi:hypothetical protein
LDKEFISRFFEATLVSNLPAGDEEAETKFRRGWADTGVQLNECLVEEAVEVGGLGRPVIFKVLAGFVFAGKFEQGGDEGRRGVLDSLITRFIGFARLL